MTFLIWHVLFAGVAARSEAHAMGPQRHLLQTNSTSPTTHQVYCYPSGTCNISSLKEGVSGFVLEGEVLGDKFGISVSGVGDMNGDKVADILIGAQNAGFSDTGRSYVVFGSNLSNAWGSGLFNITNLMNGTRGFMLQGEAASDFSGYASSGAGDLNGDNISDVIVGAYSSNPPNRTAGGKSYIVFGTSNTTAWSNGPLNVSSLMNGQRGFVLHGENPGDFSGLSVSQAGDVNGDGIADLLIGARGADQDAGNAYVIFGTTNKTAWGGGVMNLSAVRDGKRGFVLRGEQAGDESTNSLSAGDINGDGLSDILIGAYHASPDNKTSAGKVYVVFGSSNNSVWGNGILNLSELMDGRKGFVLQGDILGDNIGFPINCGDMNADGISDLYIGARNADHDGLIATGSSYVVFGTNDTAAWGNGVLNLSSLINGQRGFVLQGERTFDRSGWIGSAGDVDGDGISDLQIGGQGAQPQNESGRSYVVFGTKNSSAWGDGIMNISDLIDGVRGFGLIGQPYDQLGWRVGNVDLNDDGLSDLIVGGHLANVRGQDDVGRTYVVFGKGLSSFSFLSNQLHIAPGRTVNLTLENLNMRSNLSGVDLRHTVFSVTNLVNGKFFSGSSSITSFSLQNVTDGRVRFEHNGSAFAPRYRLWATHPQISSLTAIYSDALTSAGPVLLNNQLSVTQRVPLVLNLSDLSATDSDDFSESLVFRIVAMTGGQFNEIDLNGTVIALNITQFTQQEVAERRIQLVPDGTPSPPRYNVTVSDAFVTSAPQPVLITNFLFEPQFHFQTIIVDEGQPTTLRWQDINATDNETASDQLRIEIENVTGGHFTFDGAGPIMSFNQSVLRANQIAFVIGPLPGAVNFTLRAFDGFLYTPWGVPVIIVNHIPTVQGNISAVSIAKNRQFDVVVRNVFSDPDIADNLSYVPRLENGEHLPQEIHFISPNRFVGQLLGAEKLVIEITATDPRGLNASIKFVLENFNNRPILNLSPITIDQDRPTTLRYQDINVTDEESFTEDLVIEVTNITGGQFIYTSAPERGVTAFRQLALILGTLQFSQNGSNFPPTFAFRAYDSVLYTPWLEARVILNAKPKVQIQLVDQSVTADEAFRINLPANIFDAVDGDNLTFVARLQGGAPLPVGIIFTPPNQFRGTLSTPGSFAIEIEVEDPRRLKATAPFTLRVFPPPILTEFDFRALYTSASSAAGVVATILAYLWLRKRIARHRQGFTFANALRTVLDLEYYDFMRFDGEIYKSKVDNFLQRLQLDHRDFYSRLAPQEKESFAVCVAETITARGLVTPSDMGMGMFGLICCLNVGWPCQMALKRFEAESVEIAAEAIGAWKNTVEYKFRPMSELEDGKENGTIYVEVKGDALQYIVVDKGSQRGGEKGTINASEFEITSLPPDFDRLSVYFPQVVDIAAKNGHTRTDKALRRWPYHLPSTAENCKVCFCLQPSHAKTFVTDVQVTRSIELEKLKEYEGIDVKVEPVERKKDAETRMISLEQENKTMREESRTIREENKMIKEENEMIREESRTIKEQIKTMTTTMKTLSEKFDGASKPLLSTPR